MAAYLLNHNILEKVTNSIYLILCFEIGMSFSSLDFNINMHIKLEINPFVWPIFQFFENVVILEITLQQKIESRNCFGIKLYLPW